jgi:hypothetical protein
MPNWCSCDLIVTGNKSELDKFLDSSYVADPKDPEKKELCLLDAHYPMPESLNITSGSNVDMAYAALFGDDEQLNYWLKMPWAPERGILDKDSLLKYVEKDCPDSLREARIAKDNFEKYKAKNWYDWCTRNWGVKWPDSDTVLRYQKPKSLKFSFDTPWSPPLPALEVISRKWPTLKFSLKYYEQGMAFQGHHVIQNGEVLTDETGTYSGHRGG